MIIESGNSSEVIIWDLDGPPPVGNWKTILWRAFNDPLLDNNSISMPLEVEKIADELRLAYLKWVFDCGELRVGEKNIKDHLELRDGFSYWWMTSVSQKFNASDTSEINNILKVFALEKILILSKPFSIKIFSKKKKLIQVLSELCNLLSLKYEVNDVDKLVLIQRLKPTSLQASFHAFLYLSWCIYRYRPSFSKKALSPDLKNCDLTFIDIFAHMESACLDNKFISGYWTILVEKLSEWGGKGSWLHMYYRHRNTKSLKNALSLIKGFNDSPNRNEVHTLIEANLTFQVLFRAIKDYFRLRKIYKNIRGVEHIKPVNSKLNIWPLVSNEWMDSLCGKGAMKNCIQLSLIGSVIKDLPRQKLGVYIMENQPWEMALIHSWKDAGHGKLIGVPHTIIRYWDLRYFYDVRSYSADYKNNLPQPDIVAVNGPVAYKMMSGGHYPMGAVIEVEALRFLHLSKLSLKKDISKKKKTEISVIIFGDFKESTTKKMLSWIESAAKNNINNFKFTFKPHPACFTSIKEYKINNLNISFKSAKTLLVDCDLVFASNNTSTSLEAYYMGVPVIQMLDGASINLSPLRDIKGATYVSHPDQLLAAMLETENSTKKIDDYFNLDNNLIKWKILLGY